MLSKNKIKYLRSLHQKKYRDREKKFLIEGEKIVSEAILQRPEDVCEIFCTSNWVQRNDLAGNNNIPLEIVDEKELNLISCLKTPQPVLAVMNRYTVENRVDQTSELTLILDTIQDPGNLGTIIRLAEWFGVQEIICSENCVECFNPKVIQATMGAILRVKISYQDIQTLLKKEKSKVYAATLNGHNLYETKLEKPALIILGNESKGISEEILKLVDEEIFIPSFNSDEYNSESLNVSMAASVLCSEFMRQFTQSETKG